MHKRKFITAAEYSNDRELNNIMKHIVSLIDFEFKPLCDLMKKSFSLESVKNSTDFENSIEFNFGLLTFVAKPPQRLKDDLSRDIYSFILDKALRNIRRTLDFNIIRDYEIRLQNIEVKLENTFSWLLTTQVILKLTLSIEYNSQLF